MKGSAEAVHCISCVMGYLEISTCNFLQLLLSWLCCYGMEKRGAACQQGPRDRRDKDKQLCFPFLSQLLPVHWKITTHSPSVSWHPSPAPL